MLLCAVFIVYWLPLHNMSGRCLIIKRPHVTISGDRVITNYTIPRHLTKRLETKETCSRLLNLVTAGGECLNSGC